MRLPLLEIDDSHPMGHLQDNVNNLTTNIHRLFVLGGMIVVAGLQVQVKDL